MHQLVDLCRSPPSFRHQHLTLLRLERNDAQVKAHLTKIEFIELLCRVAFVLDTELEAFMSEKLLPLIQWHHSKLWEVKRSTSDEEAPSHDTFLH